MSMNETKNPEYTDILNYILNTDENCNCDAFCDPLRWYIHLHCRYSNRKPQNQADLEKELNYSNGVLSKKLHPETKQHRVLYRDDIERICSKLDMPFSSILFLYERRNTIMNHVNLKSDFDSFVTLFSSGFTELVKNKASIEKSPYQEVSKTSNKSNSPVNAYLKRWLGKWYFYIPSSDSSIIKNRKKRLLKHEGCDLEDKADFKELFDLYSNDHIYCGTLEITDSDDHRCRVKLQYLTNPTNIVVAQFDGTATLSPNGKTIFIEPSKYIDNEIFYVIADTIDTEQNFSFTLASVLTLAKNRIVTKRRPSCLRMALCRNIIPFNSRIYHIMTSNLMMNDNIIRIDEYGYYLLKKNQKEYNSPGLDAFLEQYPEIDSFIGDGLSINKCAYIDEKRLKILNNIDPDEAIYVEAILRLHSIAPWFSKVKVEKSNDVLDILDSNNL